MELHAPRQKSEGSTEEAASPTADNGVIYIEAIYREYTDATFPILRPRPAQWEHLGILGPLIRAKVGDTVESGAL